MKERPIIFGGPMVRAILDGSKTQTRRIVKLRDGSLAQDEDIPAHGECDGLVIPPPDYVMDFSKTFPQWQNRPCPYGKPGDHLWVRETFSLGTSQTVTYKADFPDSCTIWKPSIHMPRWASRITLEVVSVRVERLQDISEEDAKAEGAAIMKHDAIGWHSHKRGFQSLWESINGPGSWEANQWVWVVEFKRIQP